MERYFAFIAEELVTLIHMEFANFVRNISIGITKFIKDAAALNPRVNWMELSIAESTTTSWKKGNNHEYRISASGRYREDGSCHSQVKDVWHEDSR
jgi:hypothetical protein